MHSEPHPQAGQRVILKDQEPLQGTVIIGALHVLD